MSADDNSECGSSSVVRNDEYTPRAKRTRRKPARFKADPFAKSADPAELLIKQLKSWSDTSLRTWSELLHWKWDATDEEIASVINVDKRSVEKLTSMVMKNQWKDTALANGIGSGILVKEDGESMSTERPLDFWHQLSSMLTPQELNTSYQLSLVLKGIAENSPAEYAPIYEYLAIIMDDPASTVHMNPKLSGLQSGILLEILHSIAASVKDTSKLQPLLRNRAKSVVEGDWDTLNMPVREDENSPMTPSLKKRVSLQCLNPFGMPKDALPAVLCEPPSESNQILANITSRTPVASSLRPTSEMNRIYAGYTTMNVVHETPRINVDYRKTCKSIEKTSP